YCASPTPSYRTSGNRCSLPCRWQKPTKHWLSRSCSGSFLKPALDHGADEITVKDGIRNRPLGVPHHAEPRQPAVTRSFDRPVGRSRQRDKVFGQPTARNGPIVEAVDRADAPQGFAANRVRRRNMTTCWLERTSQMKIKHLQAPTNRHQRLA